MAPDVARCVQVERAGTCPLGQVTNADLFVMVNERFGFADVDRPRSTPNPLAPPEEGHESMTDTTLEKRVYGTLRRYTSEPTARGIVRRARERVGANEANPSGFLDAVVSGARLFVEEPDRTVLVRELNHVLRGNGTSTDRARIRIFDEHSARRARLLVRKMAEDVGAGRLEALRVATAMSELTRNALMYAGSGSVEIELLDEPRRIRVVVSDSGPGIGNLEDILAGRYVSKTGLGRGLRGVQKLSDQFRIDSGPSGTCVEIEMTL